jgi:UDP-glucose 4-epimerase
MEIGITGGAGFIGANLARHLLDAGARVRILDDLSTGYRENLRGLDVDLVEGSILDEADLRSLEGCDAIVHLAAIPSVPRSVANPLPSHDANATGTLRVLQAARGTNAHVIVASSSSVYGANPALPKVESMRPMPVSPYAVSKLAAESYAIAFQQCYDLPTLAFRFFNVYGPLQAPGHAYAAVVPAFTYAAVRKEPLKVHGDGQQTRDFTYVNTVVATIADAIERKVRSLEPVNLAFGTRHSLLHVVNQLEAEVGHHLDVEFEPTRVGDVRDSQADGTLVRTLFPTIRPVPLEDGIRATLEWMRSRGSEETRG